MKGTSFRNVAKICTVAVKLINLILKTLKEQLNVVTNTGDCVQPHCSCFGVWAACRVQSDK